MASFNQPYIQPARILLLEDSDLDAELIRENLDRLHPRPKVHRAVNRGQYVAALNQTAFDLILSDFSLPDFDGMSALEMAHARVPETPFIFVSGVLGEEAAIESFRRGATDYILKQRLIRLSAAVERALTEARERDELRRAEHHRELLVRELSHRVKNTMAMVMSIVRRTAKGAEDVDSYMDNLLGRLRAMADAHALLFETNWKEAQLEDVISRTTAAYVRDAARIEIGKSPSVRLSPKAALALSMVLNELVTNALKYGALCHESGRVMVSWTRERGGEDNDLVTFSWRERGGPAVSPPEKPGFGTVLIERTIQYELEGEVSLAYLPTGFTCRFSFPLEALEIVEPFSEGRTELRNGKGFGH